MADPPSGRGRRRAAFDLDRYLTGIRAGDRAFLSRAITLIESRRPEHRERAQALLAALLPATGGARRLGITGVPGVGKSTFIDALGFMLTGQGFKVAVLAVDPSSELSGGSILGDKTRMRRLAAVPSSFIRPSPASGASGGVARMTRETMLLCEAASFDVVMVETMGVGQAETLVAGMVDSFLVLALPGAGDELQGLKKGIVELADIIVVNKADGDRLGPAEQAAHHYKAALDILAADNSDWTPPVLLASALEERGLNAVWAEIEAHRRSLEASGALEAKRRRQRVAWFRSALEARLLDRLHHHPELGRRLPRIEEAVAAAEIPVGRAVDEVLQVLFTASGDADPS